MFAKNPESNEKIPVSQSIVNNCQYVIYGFILLAVGVGIFTGYYFHKGEAEAMFIPLFVAFITVFIAYMFIDLRSELVADNKEKALYLCDTYFLVLLVATVAIGVATGYFFHTGDAVNMFLPLLIAFMCVISSFLFIEIKGELVADKKVDSY